MVDFTNVTTIIDLVIGILLISCLFFLSHKFKFSKYALITETIMLLLVVLSWMFNLSLCFNISIIGSSLVIFVFSVYYLPNIRVYFKNFGKKNIPEKKKEPSKIIDHQALFKEIYETASICSRNKIGALITFERNDDLIPLTKNGTRINAPVTHELLTTIFYPGTRLHDGAVIIKDGMIYAASVYYTPTTKALTGKYGSRHRAALGISEISDSITVVVSEETGRVSIAENGELEVVSLDNLIRELEDKINEK